MHAFSNIIDRPKVSEWLLWLPIIIGLTALYGPTLYDLFNGAWSSAEQIHGPVLLGVAVWLIHRNWPEMEAVSTGPVNTKWGWPIFAFALIVYLLGRSQEMGAFELGSVIFMLIAILLLLRGTAALKVHWFALFFMVFMIPLPPVVSDTLTMPMKMAVSYATEHLLFELGYPIARSGVILQIDQYMLLVADACAGLHTLLTLEALGLLYLKLVQRGSSLRNIGLAILIVPISLTANVIRVTSLSLITYYFGEDAGQGFLHGFAGIVLFLSALLLIFGLDTMLQWVETYFQRRRMRVSLV
jgi:exosortase B